MTWGVCLCVYRLGNNKKELIHYKLLSVKKNTGTFFLFRCSEGNVELLHLVSTGQHTSTGDSSEHVSACTLHHTHKALVLQDLSGTINRTVVLDSTATGHHHAPSNGVDWVGSESRDHGHRPTEEEAENDAGVWAEHHWLQGIEKSEVKTSVDEDTDTRDDKTSVETTNTVGGESLLVDIDQTVVLSLSVLALGVISQSSTGKIETVDDGEGERTGATTTGNVTGELFTVAGVLWHGDGGLDGVFEGKVQRLGWEVSEYVGQVTSPEWSNSLGGERSLGTVENACVWLVESTLFDHLILILDQELDTLDWRRRGLRDTGSDTREHKVLGESKFFIGHFGGEGGRRRKSGVSSVSST